MLISKRFSLYLEKGVSVLKNLSKILDFSRGYALMSTVKPSTDGDAGVDQGFDCLPGVDGPGGSYRRGKMTHFVSILPLNLFCLFFSASRSMAENIKKTSEILSNEWFEKNSPRKGSKGASAVGKIVTLYVHYPPMPERSRSKPERVEIQLEFNTFMFTKRHQRNVDRPGYIMTKPEASDIKVFLKVLSTHGASSPANKFRLDSNGLLRTSFGYHTTARDFVEMLGGQAFDQYIQHCLAILDSRTKAINKEIDKEVAKVCESRPDLNVPTPRRVSWTRADSIVEDVCGPREFRRPDISFPTAVARAGRQPEFSVNYYSSQPPYKVPCDVAVGEADVFAEDDGMDETISRAVDDVIAKGFDHRSFQDPGEMMVETGDAGGGGGMTVKQELDESADSYQGGEEEDVESIEARELEDQPASKKIKFSERETLV